MADNDLAQAYSILGQGLSSTYRNRRKEEEDYRDDARRDARKEQLISYVAAPILQGAGKALASGATDLVGNLVLGENGKDFFNTEKGRVAARRSRFADTQEQKLLKTQAQFMQGGMSELEGQVKFLTDGYTEKLKREYGDSPENAPIRGLALREAIPDLEKEAERLVKERQELIDYASKSPDMDVLKARLKEKDSFYGKTKGQRIMSTLVGKIFGKNPAEQGASYILTGSTDPTEAQRILRDNLMSDTYVKDFSTQLTNLGAGRKNAYESAFTTFASNNPVLVSSMRKDQAAATQRRAVEMDYIAYVSTSVNKFNQTDPGRAAWYGDNQKNYNNKESLDSAYFNAIGGFSKDAIKVEGDRYVNSYINQENVKKLVTAVAFSRTNLTGEVINDLEAFKETKQYNVVVQETSKLINNVLVPSYNKDLSLAMSKMSTEQKEALLGSLGAKEELLRRYLDFQISSNLATEKTIFTKNAFLPDATAEESVALLKDSDAGLRFILNQNPDNLIKGAQVNGIYKDKVSEEMESDLIEIQPTAPSKFNYIEEMNGPQDVITREVEAGLAILKGSLIKRSAKNGSTNKDGEGVLSASTLASFEEFSSLIYARVDARFEGETTAPAASTSRFPTGSLSLGESDRAATIARGELNKKRRADTADKFSRTVEILEDMLTRDGDVVGRQKGKKFGSPEEQASSLLSSPTNPNPGFRSDKQSYLK